MSASILGKCLNNAEIKFSRNNYNAKLTLATDKRAWVVDEIDTLPEGTQPQITVEELIECDELVRKDGELDPASTLQDRS